MDDDPSAGWEAVAAAFAAMRSDVGVEIVERWSAHLPPGGTIVDVGCGTGRPVAAALAARGFDVWGIDPSATLLAAFRRTVPGATVACEAAQTSRFFGRRFDGAVAIGVLFLLPEEGQRATIHRVGRVLRPGGHFLFSAPWQACAWHDTLTGRPSSSLGAERYRELLAEAGCCVVAEHVDRGANHYFHAASQPA